MTGDSKLAKHGDALKPSTIIHHFKHSSDEESTNGHGHPDGHNEDLSDTSSKAELKTRDKQDKEDRLQAEKDEAERHREEKDREAAANDTPDMLERYGDLAMPGEIIPLEEVVKMTEGREVTFRARIHVQRAVSSKLDFIVFRQRGVMIQGVLHDDCSEHMIKWVERLPNETIVQVSGTLRKPPSELKASLDSPLEISVQDIYLVENSNSLPFRLSGSAPPQSTRLGNRILDLRHPSNQAIMRIRAKILQVYRDVLDKEEFMEIQTPKLLPAATESGAEVFKVNHFGRKAFLAQSPQLAKQMAISADFGRVYEVSPSSTQHLPFEVVADSRLVQCSGRRIVIPIGTSLSIPDSTSKWQLRRIITKS
jgi:lysyl-tRNA synthetase class II